MQVLFINRFFHPDQSATSRLLTDLAEGLCRQGVGVSVLTSRLSYSGTAVALPAEETYHGVTVRRLWSTQFGRRSSIGRLFDYVSFYLSLILGAIRSRGIDCVVVLSDPPMLSVLAAFLGWLKGWQTVCWLQDVFPEIALKAGVLKQGKLASALLGIAHRSLRATDRMIVLGRCMEQRVLAMDIPRDRVTVIPNWADGECLRRLAPDDNQFRKDHKLEGRTVVMYAGNLGVVHEAESLMSIIRGLRVMPEVCVIILGDGSRRLWLEERVRRERIENTRFLGYEPQYDLRQRLSAGDIHLVTLRPEMQGLSIPSKVYGIMAVSRPVIFMGPVESEVGMLIRDAGCGEAFDPTDHEKATHAVLDLARDTGRREYLGSAGRLYFETHLDKPLAVQRFHNVLRNVELT